MIIYNKTNDGFTLLEIIAVLVVLGVISTVVVVGNGVDSVGLLSQVEEIKSHIRFTQTKAMATDLGIGNNTSWGIRTNNSGTQYWMYSVNNSNPVALPGKENTVITLADYDITDITPFNITFNDWGIPFNNNVEIDNELKITVKDGDSSKDFTILPQTGFVK